jgi:hypothetical protein
VAQQPMVLVGDRVTVRRGQAPYRLNDEPAGLTAGLLSSRRRPPPDAGLQKHPNEERNRRDRS